jgi:hypothetical protein
VSDGDGLAGHAFLSYGRDDQVAVDRLHQILEAAGIKVWRDTYLQPGEDWRMRIRQSITREALVFIACFSSHGTSLRASHQNEELVLAIEQFRIRNPAIPWLIPVRLDDCSVPDFNIGGGRTLASLRCVDLFGAHREIEIARLLAAVWQVLGVSDSRRPPKPTAARSSVVGPESSPGDTHVSADMTPRMAAAILARLEPGQIASELGQRDIGTAIAIMAELPPALIAQALNVLTAAQASEYLALMESRRAAAVVRHAHQDADWIVMVLDEMTPGIISRIIQKYDFADLKFWAAILTGIDPDRAACVLEQLASSASDRAGVLLGAIPAEQQVDLFWRIDESAQGLLLRYLR